MPTAGPPSTEPAQPRSKPKITTNGKFMKPAKRKAVIEPEDEEADDELEEKAVLEAEDVVIHRGRKRSENGKVTQAPLKLQLSVRTFSLSLSSRVILTFFSAERYPRQNAGHDGHRQEGRPSSPDR